jgi:hypothetical protein
MQDKHVQRGRSTDDREKLPKMVRERGCSGSSKTQSLRY